MINLSGKTKRYCIPGQILIRLLLNTRRNSNSFFGILTLRDILLHINYDGDYLMEPNYLSIYLNLLKKSSLYFCPIGMN